MGTTELEQSTKAVTLIIRFKERDNIKRVDSFNFRTSSF